MASPADGGVELHAGGFEARRRRHQHLAGARDPAEAVVLAEQATRITRGEDPAVLYTLATALAADGRTEGAVETAERALGLAVAGGAAELAEEIRRFLASDGDPSPDPAAASRPGRGHRR